MPTSMYKPAFNGRYHQSFFINIRHTLKSENLLPSIQSLGVLENSKGSKGQASEDTGTTDRAARGNILSWRVGGGSLSGSGSVAGA